MVSGGSRRGQNFAPAGGLREGGQWQDHNQRIIVTEGGQRVTEVGWMGWSKGESRSFRQEVRSKRSSEGGAQKLG